MLSGVTLRLGGAAVTAAYRGAVSVGGPRVYPTVADPYTFTTSTGQAARIDFPAGWVAATATPLVIQSRGVGFDTGGNLFEQPTMSDAALAAGWAFATCAFHGDSYGSPAALADLAALIAEARRVANIGPVVLWGNSMGGMLALNAVTTGTLIPAGVYLTDSVVDLRQRYDNGRAATIQAAYGIASDGPDYAAKTAGYDPALRAAGDFLPATLRFRDVGSTNDTQVDLDAHGYLLEAKLGSERVNVRDIGDTGHNTAGRFIPSDFTEFLTSVLTPDATAPTAPVLTGTPGDTTVGLSWTASTDTIGTVRYRVKRGTTVLTPNAITGTTYTDTGRTNSTQYAYTVEAINAQGLVTTSNTATVTPAATLVLPADTFDVAGDLGGASLTSGGGTWTLLGSAAGAAAAASEIVKSGGTVGTKAGGLANAVFASTPMGATSYTVEVDLAAINAAAASRGGGLMVRASASGVPSFIWLNTRVSSTVQGYAAFKQSGGTATAIAATQSTTIIPTVGDRLRAVVTPDTVTFFVVRAGTPTQIGSAIADTANGTSTLAGLFWNTTSTDNKYDNLARTA